MKLVALLLLLILSGCAGLSQVSDKATDAIDDAIDVGNKLERKAVNRSHQIICDEVDVKLWLEKYAHSPEMLSAWWTVCGRKHEGIGAVLRAK